MTIFKQRKYFLGLGCFFLCLITSPVMAQDCQLEWHNSLSLNSGKLTLVQGDKTFTIKQDGRLYFDIHKVKLSVEQRELLADYFQILSDDLPYLLSHSQNITQQVCGYVMIRRNQEKLLQANIPALKGWQSVTLK